MRASLLVALLAACGSRAPRDLRVTSYAPSQPVDTVEPIEIHFDKPVVAADRIGTQIAPSNVIVTPAFAWRGAWKDRQTLVIEPTSVLAPSTRYEITLAAELGERSGAFTFSFVHAPLEIEGVWGVDAEALPPDGDVPLSFNEPVHARDAAAACKLTGAHGVIALAANPDEIAANITLRPIIALEHGAAYTLSCLGLAGAGGNAPLDKPYSLAVRARPGLSITRIEPRGDHIATDDVALAITFSTPVALADVRAAISSVPAIPGIDRGTLSADGTEYRIIADLEPATDYALRVAGLADRFGQLLVDPVDATFHTGDAAPRLSIAPGIHAVAKRYPLWSRNVGAYEIECAAVSRDRLVSVIASDSATPIDWPTTPRTTTHTLARRSAWQLAELDLGATCSGRPGAPGVYLATVRSAEVTPSEYRTIANVTDLGVLLAPGVVWVTSRSTGAAVADAKVTLVAPDGTLMMSHVTNADGLVKLAASESPRSIAIVEKGADLAIVDGTSTTALATWNFGELDDRATPHPIEPVQASDTSPAPFELELVAAPTPGERLTFELDAKSHTGAPIAGANVEWSLRKRAHAAQFAGYDGYTFAPASDSRDDELVADGGTLTDARGHVAITARDPVEANGAIDYVLAATVTEASDRTMHASAIVMANEASVHLGIRANAVVPSTESSFGIDLVALRSDGTRVATRAHLSLVRTALGCSSRDVAGRCDRREAPVIERDLAIAADGSRVQLDAIAAGRYLVRVTSEGATTTRELWVLGNGAAFWSEVS